MNAGVSTRPMRRREDAGACGAGGRDAIEREAHVPAAARGRAARHQERSTSSVATAAFGAQL